MINRFYIFLISILSLPSLVISQNDSLELQKKIDDAGSIINHHPDSALVLLKNLMAVVKGMENYAMMGKTANNIGTAYKRKSKFTEAEAAHMQSIGFSRKAGDSLLVAESIYSLGILYRHMGRYTDALELMNQSLELRINYQAAPLYLARTYNGIGSVLYTAGKAEGSVEYFKKSYYIHEKIGNGRYAASSAVNIGAVLTELEQPDSATYYLNQGLAYFRSKNQELGAAAALINLAEIETKKGNLELAKTYSEEAYLNFKKIGDQARIGMSLSSLAKIEQGLGNYNKAISYSKESLAIAQKVGRMDNVRDQYLELSKIYADAELWQNAYQQQELHTSLKDSLFNTEIDAQMQEQQLKFETAEKDREILNLKKEQEFQARQRRWLLLGLFGLTLFGIAILLNYLARQKALQKLRKEQKITTQLLHEKEKLLSDLNKAQNSLVQSEKMISLGQLTAGIAHEINNPINFITSSIAALKFNFEDIQKLLGKIENLEKVDNLKNATDELIVLKKELDSEELQQETEQLIKGISTGAERTLKIVNSLRIFSRNTTENFHPADINEGIESTLALLRNNLKEGVHVKTDFGELPLVVCQISRLNQVFLNIINNGLQSIEHSGKIDISTSLHGEEVKIEISDTGKGMDADTQRRIFEPFFTTKEVGKGTGLGLSISYGIVEQHNGRFEVESKEGKGSRFIIWLPIVPENAGEVA